MRVALPIWNSSEDGKVCPHRLNALIFNEFRAKYFVLGEKVGDAWGAGKELL